MYALLIQQEEHEHWVITERPQHGPGVYTWVFAVTSPLKSLVMTVALCSIQTRDGSLGWVYPLDDDDPSGPQVQRNLLVCYESLSQLLQIQVRPLKATHSIPPFFPDTEIFKFLQIDEED